MTITERIEHVLHREAAAIQSVRVTPSFSAAVMLILGANGSKILTTGMGKAGHVAERFAATLCSTGTPALFVHPGEASHGDAGAVQPGDVLVAFSTSGKTREVLEFIAAARALGLATVVGVTSHPDSVLRDHSDILIDMGEIAEPCPMGLVPSASLAVMSAIGDAMALAAMEQRGFTPEEFGRRHHGGYLGMVSAVFPTTPDAAR